jgi:uncharacterized DUF497 family protein
LQLHEYIPVLSHYLINNYLYVYHTASVQDHLFLSICCDGTHSLAKSTVLSALWNEFQYKRLKVCNWYRTIGNCVVQFNFVVLINTCVSMESNIIRNPHTHNLFAKSIYQILRIIGVLAIKWKRKKYSSKIKKSKRRNLNIAYIWFNWKKQWNSSKEKRERKDGKRRTTFSPFLQRGVFLVIWSNVSKLLLNNQIISFRKADDGES